MSHEIAPDVVDEGRRIAELASAEDVPVRLIGGVAVRLHARAGLPEPLVRSYRDIDLVTARKSGRDAARLLAELGYVANERFNAMNGSTRQVFYDVVHNRQVDVFVGEFRMCHVIPVAERLHADSHTVPLAELLLTKTQIVQLNGKDLADIWGLVHEHDVSDHDDDSINGDRVAELLAGDWGLWRTTRQSIETARERLPASGLEAADQALVDERLQRLWERIEREPKGLRWRSRAKVGDRTKWYEEPEEIAHGEPADPRPTPA